MNKMATFDEEIYEMVDFSNFNPENNMSSGIGTLSWTNVKSAVIYGVMTLVSVFGLAIVQGILKAGSLFGLDWKAIIDSATIATLPTLITGLSLMKNFFTTDSGKFAGIIKVTPPQE